MNRKQLYCNATVHPVKTFLPSVISQGTQVHEHEREPCARYDRYLPALVALLIWIVGYERGGRPWEGRQVEVGHHL